MRTRLEGRALQSCQACCIVHLLGRVFTQSRLLTVGVLLNTWSLSMSGAIVFLALAVGCWCAAPLFLLESKEDIACRLEPSCRKVEWLGSTMPWPTAQLQPQFVQAGASVCEPIV